MASVLLPAIAGGLQDKPSATESGGVGRQPPPAKLLVTRGSEPSARQKPSAAEIGGVGDRTFGGRGHPLHCWWCRRALPAAIYTVVKL
jgi:hypothetical protein